VVAGTFKDYGLVRWHPFYVGVATYTEQHEGTLEKREQLHQHRNMVERERSWWGCVGELQRFVTQQ
jgi:hypothetical protein